jgi:hypothetical protein
MSRSSSLPTLLGWSYALAIVTIRARMKSSLGILSFLLALAIASLAGEIRKGATMEVKANLIWFQEVKDLTRWQQLKKGGNSNALSDYQKKLLSNRDAWQFTNPLTVKVVSYDAAKHQVKVEMETAGRMQGTTWFLDSDALVR